MCSKSTCHSTSRRRRGYRTSFVSIWQRAAAEDGNNFRARGVLCFCDEFVLKWIPTA